MNQEWIEKLEQEGFGQIESKSFTPNEEIPEHTHDQHTLQLVLDGELTVTDKQGSKLYKAGDRLESLPGTKHGAKCGPEGCKFVVGTK